MNQACFSFNDSNTSRFDNPLPVRFDGSTYSPEQDSERLATQLDRVRAVMSDGEWHTLGELYMLVGGSMQGISARIRDLRKARFGGYNVEHRRVSGGQWEYRMVLA